MIAYLVKRLVQGIAVMLVISALGFAIQSHLGDPLRDLVGQSLGQEAQQQLRQDLGLDDPYWAQYVRFLGRVVQGDLGTSLFFDEPALQVILKKLPATLELVFAATVIIVLLSVPLGVYTAIRPHAILSRVIMGLSVLGISTPVFLTAILMISVFSVGYGWLPAFGRGDVVPVVGYWETNFASLDGLSHILLPSVALAAIMLPMFIRLIRAEMLEVLQSDYVKYARAKGLHPLRIYYVHALKNTLMPVITLGGVQIGTMVAYTILTETVFQWPGMGFMFLEAVNRADTPLIVAYLIVVGLIFVLTNTLVDLIYALVNPTVKLARMGA
ncbi:ABC transporter permease [Thalassovita sp.]|uniref:ABC transporter permease n=1 Tax=Thalassovita sp. TaxID=1979401 RepID=UPI002AB0D7FC|nr:ABC transporter permease [Thalassovita sp.]